MSGDDAGPEEFAVTPEAKRLHDLRQPIAAIMAAATALRAHTGLDEAERDAFLRVIIQSAERLAGMLEGQTPAE